MKKMMRLLVFLASAFLLTGCEKVFEYSPYEERNSSDYLNLTGKNIALINNLPQEEDGFNIALTSDSHGFHNQLGEVVDHIKSRSDLDFAVHNGDLTDFGLMKEFIITADIMDGLNIPYLTTIGNHDCLANGFDIYRDIYGSVNYTLVYKDCKFVFFNNVIWELNNQPPDLNWLESALYDYDDYRHVFVFAHIAPFSDQMRGVYEEEYSRIMRENSVDVSFHGHNNSYFNQEHYEDGVNYVIIPYPKNTRYLTLSVSEEGASVELVDL